MVEVIGEKVGFAAVNAGTEFCPVTVSCKADLQGYCLSM